MKSHSANFWVLVVARKKGLLGLMGLGTQSAHLGFWECDGVVHFAAGSENNGTRVQTAFLRLLHAGAHGRNFQEGTGNVIRCLLVCSEASGLAADGYRTACLGGQRWPLCVHTHLLGGGLLYVFRHTFQRYEFKRCQKCRWFLLSLW